MTKPQKKAPELRFKGFTEDWEQRKLGEETEIVAGGDVDKSKLLKAGKYPVVANALTNDGIVGYYENDYRIEAPAVTVTGRGDVGYAQARKANFTPVVRLLSVKSKHDVDFLENAINQHKILVESTGVPQLTSPQLANYKIWFTSLEEEKKIGEFFSQLDHLITLHQRKYTDLLRLKEAYLQNMFPATGESIPKIRFANFVEKWEQRKWLDTIDISTNMVDPKSGKYDNLPHIGPGNIESFTGQIYNNVNTVKEDSLISGKFYFNKGDIIYGKINPQLGKYFLATFEGLASADAYVLNTKNGLNQTFLFALLQTHRFFKYSVSVSMRSGMPKINRNELNEYKFNAPSELEQKRIGEFLLQFDNTIILHQQKLEKLKHLKEAYLQKMFV